MKQYIYLKQSPLIELAHLYEHIVCIELTKLLCKKNLYIYLDYDIVGKTYNGGLVYLEINQYTNKRINMHRILSNLEIVFNDNIVALGISQLIAEKNAPFGSNGTEKIIVELERLHKSPWVMIDDFNIIDSTNIRRKNSPIYVAEGKLPKQTKLHLSVVYDRTTQNSDVNHLTPLFRQLSYLIMSNLEELICNEFGYFGASNSFKNDKQTCKLTHTLQVGVSKVDLESCKNITQNLIESMVFDQTFKRLSHQLRSLSYKQTPHIAVNFEKNYEDTLVFIGSKGWKLVATSENIDTLLSNISFELSYGQQREVFSLK